MIVDEVSAFDLGDDDEEELSEMQVQADDL